jgi:hypothetical protein
MYIMGEERNVYRILVGKPEGNRPQDAGGQIIIMKLILQIYYEAIFIGSIW